MLVLSPVLPPARPCGGAPVGGLGLLGGPQVVEVSAVRAGADGPVQAHGALAGLLGLALARPHVHGPGRDRGQEEEGVIWIQLHSPTGCCPLTHTPAPTARPCCTLWFEYLAIVRDFFVPPHGHWNKGTLLLYSNLFILNFLASFLPQISKLLLGMAPCCTITVQCDVLLLLSHQNARPPRRS